MKEKLVEQDSLQMRVTNRVAGTDGPTEPFPLTPVLNYVRDVITKRVATARGGRAGMLGGRHRGTDIYSRYTSKYRLTDCNGLFVLEIAFI